MANESKCGLAELGYTDVSDTGDTTLTGDSVLGPSLVGQAVAGLGTETTNFAAYLQFVAQLVATHILHGARGGIARMGSSNAGELFEMIPFSTHKDTGLKSELAENTLAGTVLSQGNPVEDAWVVALDQSSLTIVNKTQTAADGTFALPVWAGAECIVFAFKGALTDTDADVFARVIVPIP